MGGWSSQVHHHQDVICDTGLQRSASVKAKLLEVSAEVEPGVFLLPPHYALADSLVHGDHRVMTPDEIDPDYIDQDERPRLREALEVLGCPEDEIPGIMAPYDFTLSDGQDLSI
jgi:hypothetical protein